MRVPAGEVTLSVQVAGEGPPILLLHGFPQTHMCWEHVAPALASERRVVVPDLRGYGESDAPPCADGTRYAKRVMARDMRALMAALGHDEFDLMGHDRGARVAYRLTLDDPSAVRRLAIVEVIPTVEVWRAIDADLALAMYHWVMMAQPQPVPERMIGADPVAWVDHTLASWTKSKSLAPFSEAALASYRVQMTDPARVAAMCSDYRAGATVDRKIDAADETEGRLITAPMLFLYAAQGFPARSGDPLGTWRRWAPNVRGIELNCGHFAMEETPDAVVGAARDFFCPVGRALRL
ncbi:MAG: alpha/beta hydrolase [Pseudomonadota bacterium]